MALPQRAQVSCHRAHHALPVPVADRTAAQADLQRRRARTFARQQKIAERVAAATGSPA